MQRDTDLCEFVTQGSVTTGSGPGVRESMFSPFGKASGLEPAVSGPEQSWPHKGVEGSAAAPPVSDYGVLEVPDRVAVAEARAKAAPAGLVGPVTHGPATSLWAYLSQCCAGSAYPMATSSTNRGAGVVQIPCRVAMSHPRWVFAKS
jgi:hypothetical protein